MSRNRSKLRNRVVNAAEETLARQGYVSDVLLGIGWLDQPTFKRWQRGQLPYLEQGIQTKPSRVAEAMRLFRVWAMEKRLEPSETAYVARARQGEGQPAA